VHGLSSLVSVPFSHEEPNRTEIVKLGSTVLFEEMELRGNRLLEISSSDQPEVLGQLTKLHLVLSCGLLQSSSVVLGHADAAAAQDADNPVVRSPVLPPSLDIFKSSLFLSFFLLKSSFDTSLV